MAQRVNSDMSINYFLIKAVCKILHYNGEKTCEMINRFFRKKGALIGCNCRIYSDISTSESYLIRIGDNVTISNDVQIITHDNSIIKVNPEYTDLFGEVKIGDNCFIGAHSILLPGVTLGNSCIIGAGSVVSKSFRDGAIIVGNPGRQIGNIKDYLYKYRDKGFNIDGLSASEKKQMILQNPEKLIKDRGL